MPCTGKAYCINLKARSDRRILAEAEFALHNIDVEFIPGVSASDLSSVRFIHPGQAANGCSIAHLQIIERAQLLNLPFVTVFEDDVALAHNFNEKYEAAMRELPEDWDILYLGGSHVKPTLFHSANLRRVRATYTTHAYVIRQTLYETFRLELRSFRMPADCYLVEMQPSIKAFTVTPNIAFQRPGFSDIENKEVNYARLRQ